MGGAIVVEFRTGERHATRANRDGIVVAAVVARLRAP
jgi:hypothetical protein